MKTIRLLLAASITVVLFWFLNYPHGNLPALGKLFNPSRGFWQNIVPQEQAESQSTLNLAGLQSPVTVKYDNHQIPHVFAANTHDLFFVHGYVVASQRLWQMEFQTYFAAGRLSELVGEKALRLDRSQRRKGLAYAAQKTADYVLKNDPASHAIAAAYAEGVNAYIESLDEASLPIEYKLMGYRPEKWTPYHTALFLKYLADNLSGTDYDIENTNLLSLLGKETFDLLFPDRFPNIDPVVPPGTPWDFIPLGLPPSPLNNPSASISSPTPIEGPNPNNGSNNWAVSPRKSKNGHAMLSNDPHLGLNLPSIWYVIQLHSPDINVFGATVPGSPVILSGFNENIAWGITNARRDVKDWYEIDFVDSTRTSYRYGLENLPISRRIEEIKIKGQKSFYDTVLYTHFGPIMYEPAFSNKTNAHLAMQWVGFEATEELKAMYLVNRASNYDDFTQALSHFSCPAQNFAFASISGDIAMWVNGKFPLKYAEQGKFILDGSDPQQDWSGYIPFTHNIHVLNPARGFVSSANQHPADSTYPYYVYDYTYEHYRNRRINEYLSANDNLSVQDLMALQTDNKNLIAQEALPLFLKNLQGSKLNAIQLAYASQLSEWNYFNDPYLVSPSLFELWWLVFYDVFWDEIDVHDQKLIRPNIPSTLDFIKKYPTHYLIDNKTTSAIENLSDLVQLSFIQAVDSLESLENSSEWYQLKNTTILHMAQILPFSHSEIPVGGNLHIVNATSGRHGPSWRMVVEMGEWPKAWAIYPGGQSGNPASKHYDDFIDLWAKGEYIELEFMKNIDDDGSNIQHTQQLNPKK